MSTKPCLSHDLSQHKVHYERRRPEASVLYQLVQENLDTFLAQMEAEPDGGLPEFVKDDGARLTRLRTATKRPFPCELGYIPCTNKNWHRGCDWGQPETEKPEQRGDACTSVCF